MICYVDSPSSSPSSSSSASPQLPEFLDAGTHRALGLPVRFVSIAMKVLGLTRRATVTPAECNSFRPLGRQLVVWDDQAKLHRANSYTAPTSSGTATLANSTTASARGANGEPQASAISHDR